MAEDLSTWIVPSVVYADGTLLCPLCGRTTQLNQDGVLRLHFGRERTVSGHRALRCDASRHTLAEARRMAARVREEADRLRRRAHP